MSAKKIKNVYLGGRIDSDLRALVDEYVDVMDITMGQPMRKVTVGYLNRTVPLKKVQ